MTRPVPPPAIVIGGEANAIEIARSLGRRGVRVLIVNHVATESRYSRYAEFLPVEAGAEFEAAAADLLLGHAADDLHGAVVLAASDEGIRVIATHRAALAERYLLDLGEPAAAIAMLDKRVTYEIARDAGVPTPLYWPAGTLEDVVARRDELVFPLIVKPRDTHAALRTVGAKFLVVDRYGDLLPAVRRLEADDIAWFLVEQVPGPDSNLASYYTYLDESGAPQFDFTKRIIRRSPPGLGPATYHVTDQVEGLREPALALFSRAGVRGVANVEFKLDPRDGVYRLMEVNARFTAANCLLADAGLDLSWYVYARRTGRQLPPMDTFRTGVTLWDPVRDVMSYLELRRRGEIGASTYLRSLLRRQTLPTFAWDDPQPAIRRLWHQLHGLAPGSGRPRNGSRPPSAPARGGAQAGRP